MSVPAEAQDTRLEQLPPGMRYVLASPFHATCRQYLGFYDGWQAEGSAGTVQFNDKFVWLTAVDYWISGYVTSRISDKMDLTVLFPQQPPQVSWDIHKATIDARAYAFCKRPENADRTIADIAKLIVDEVRAQLK
jgi:hypothetical protein